MKAETELQMFYSGKNLFITGATGVCGRIFLEKVVRSLPDVGQVYVLIRGRRGKTASERLARVLKGLAFSCHTYPEEQLKKIIAIEGDVTTPGLGLSTEIKELLQERVNLVFHVAASVRFTATFRENLLSNVVGTENVVKFACTLKNLTSFVHVSTAYSNCQNKSIDETLCPLLSDSVDLIEKFKEMTEEELETEAIKYFDGRPNNYTFTKALAEHVVNNHKEKLRVAIARPAIVIPAAFEPVPGFMDNTEGPVALALVAGLGILQVTNWSFVNRSEFFPVDILASCLLAIGWRTSKQPIGDLKVYNLVSSPLNDYPDDFDLLIRGREATAKYASMYAVRPLAAAIRVNKMGDLEYKVKRFLHHTLFAFLIDLILVIMQRKPLLMKVVKKMHTGMDVMKYFSDNQWYFQCDNFKQLIKEVSEEDKQVFKIDPGKVDFDRLFENGIRVGRKLILKESENTLVLARIKLKLLPIIYHVLNIGLLYLIWKLFISWTSLGMVITSMTSELLSLLSSLMKTEVH